MLDKLRPLVGLKGIAAPGASPSLYVNDLPGLSTELVDNLTEADAVDAAAVWVVVQRRTGLKFLAGVEALLVDLQDWQRFLGESGPATPMQPRNELVAPRLVGLLLNVREPETLDVYLNALEVFASSAALAVPLVAFDLGDGDPFTVEARDGSPATLPETVDLVAGYNRIDLGGVRVVTRYRTARLFVGLDLMGDGMPALLQFEATPDVPGLDFEDVFFSVGATLDTYGSGYQPYGHGVHVQISVECSAEKLVNRFAPIFASAWLNMLGAELLREKIHSDRTNYFTLSNLALSEENMGYLNTQATSALKQAAKRLPAGVACRICDPEITGGIWYDESGTLP